MPFPVEEKYIEETEKKVGARFPDAYRQRMMADNGGEICTPEGTWTLNPIFDTSDKKRLRRTCNDVVRETAQAKKRTDFPENGISIAQNGYGDHLVFLMFGGEIDPKVYFWFHETGDLTIVSPEFSILIG